MAKEVERARKWRANNLARARKTQVEWNRKNPRKVRAWRIAREFGVTHEWLDLQLAKQGDGCAICQTKTPGGKGWHIDHDHGFARTDPRGHRGVLCHRCNRGIGLLADSPGTLRAAIDYLEDHLIRLHRNAA